LKVYAIIMKLFEYQGKQLLQHQGIAVPKGTIIEGKKALPSMSFPVVLKAQVPVGGRGKAGGIQVADSEKEAAQKLSSILSMSISGYHVEKVLVEEKIPIEKEFYLSIILDRSSRMPLLMASREGGIDIESVPDDRIIKEWVNPLIGIQTFHIRRILNGLHLSGDVEKETGRIISRMYQLFRAYDCELVEINPLVQTKTGTMIALDSKVIINDDALYRHPDVVPEHVELTALEKEAKEKGISFIQLDGNIGVIANGAGLTMATLDALTHYHGKGGVFLDLGGTDDPEKVKQAFELMKKAKPKVIFLNLFGGITKCDTVAKGVKAVITKEGIHCPVVTRIKGMNEDAAKEILKDAGLITAANLQEAAKISSLKAGE
jgi:succinyl-CoA synthetase beta subunit